jgi:hypothetical protein
MPILSNAPLTRISTWSVIGFTAGTTFWCMDCATVLYGSGIWDLSTTHDNEGNPITPVYWWDPMTAQLVDLPDGGTINSPKEICGSHCDYGRGSR